jgi:membrane protease YdiL (CAAX protease family)
MADPLVIPPLTIRARVWLAGVPVVTLASQTIFALYGPDLPGSAEAAVCIEDLVLGTAALVVITGFLKIDRHAIGLTLGDRSATLIRTGIQLLILAGLAILYTAGRVVAARFGHLRVPVQPTSLTDWSNVWVFVLLAVLIGPLYEELLCRGMLLAAFDRAGKSWIAVVGSAALFVLPHWAPGITAAQLVSPFLIGVLLGWSYLRTRSILTSFLVHAAFNGGVIVKDALMHFHPEFVKGVLGYH